MAIKGVDISEFNGAVDFSLLKQNGIKFVIIRTGFGSDYPNQNDDYLDQNIKGAEAAGLPWGVYHYAYATNKSGGISEANFCLKLLNGRKPAYGVWYDMEDNSTIGGDLNGAADGFCSTIENAGLYAGVYANLNWWKNYLVGAAFAKYDKWVAQYNSTCTYNGTYGMWQYTSSLSIGGKDFDGNWAYKDYPSITGIKNENTGSESTVAKSRVLQTQENKITRGFGNGHSGVDLGWQTTQTDGIIAHSDGTVVFCQTGYGNNQGSTGNASYGNCVKLQHANGYYTLYAHLSDVTVKYGQKVTKGQVIGHMGNTGNSYGTHLHFEVRRNANTCIDPAPYIAADLPNLPTEEIKETKVNYKVEITANDLNIRSGPGTNYGSNGVMTPGTYNIVAEANGSGASKWGKLGNGKGWISLDYAKRIEEEEEVELSYDKWKEYMNKYLDELAAKPVASWATEAMEWAKAKGLIAGDFEGATINQMRPQSEATRQELIQILYNMFVK